jgi:hypothetical protein
MRMIQCRALILFYIFIYKVANIDLTNFKFVDITVL